MPVTFTKNNTKDDGRSGSAGASGKARHGTVPPRGAERDEQVAKLLPGYAVGVGTFAPMLPAGSRHRLVGLHFLDISNPDIPRPLSSVIVDLATSRLVHDSHHGDEPREA
jgi:hypothetical protein